MARYILRRLGYIVFTLLIVSVILFSISKIMPGDPALMLVDGRKLRPEQFEIAYKAAREKLGLDEPVVVQYFSWLRTMVTGDFGWSTVTRLPVAQMAAAPLGNTVKLNIFGLIFTFIITIPLGIATAVRKGKVFDQAVQVVTIIGYSLPTFIFGLLFICLFGVIIPIFPISGSGSIDTTLTGWAKTWADYRYMALPLIVYVFSSLGGITRYVRAAMIDALRMDYIRTARAKGLKEKVVIYSHAFRNSLIPFVTIFTGWFISIFGGSVIIERTFNWNGIGNVLISSLMQQDYAVVLAFYSFYAVLSLAGNLIMDIGYCLVDPRVRLS
ncbi:MAG: ABC transporter permease [Clostridiales bacterium]|jgi:peptide/nickel transport system permease protein|nr:ABC transporter permease [Clostridiales bacterium]MDR2751229.1 ABC transporter permease [Clostridiales bacterium]